MAGRKKQKVGVVKEQKYKARRILKKAATKADSQAKRSKAAGKFWGGGPKNKGRSAGKSLLARGARGTAIKHAKSSVKSTIKAARLRGAAKKIK